MPIKVSHLHRLLDMARESLNLPGSNAAELLLEILGDEALPQLILLVAKASTRFGHEDPALFYCADDKEYLLVVDAEEGAFVDHISIDGVWKQDPKVYPTDFAETVRLMRLNDHAYDEILSLGNQRKELSETRRIARLAAEETERLERSKPRLAETTQVIRKKLL